MPPKRTKATGDDSSGPPTKKPSPTLEKPIVVPRPKMSAAGVKAVQDTARAAVKETSAAVSAAKIAKLRKHAKDAIEVHQAIVKLCACYQHVLKKDFGEYGDIPKNMLGFESLVKCKACWDMGKGGKSWKSSTKLYSLEQHALMKHPHESKKGSSTPSSKKTTGSSTPSSKKLNSIASPEPELPSTTERKIVSFRNALARATLRTGVTMSQAAVFVEEMLPYMSGKPVAERPGALGVTQLKIIQAEYVACQEEKIKGFLSQSEHYALAFDGGTSDTFGLHVLVAYVFAGGCCFALPVVFRSKGQTFDGGACGAALTSLMIEYGIEIAKIRLLW